MTATPRRRAATSASDAATYEFRTAGHLDDHWSARLDSRCLVRNDDGTTSLTVEVADQAQLHGVLASIRDIGVPLLSLNVLDAPDSTGLDAETKLSHQQAAPAGEQRARRAANTR